MYAANHHHHRHPHPATAFAAVLAVASCWCATNAFNFDAKNYARYDGQPGSMFGFTVAAHRARGQSWILVGAPEAQSHQPDVERGGIVMRCQWDHEQSCVQLPFDLRGPNVDNHSHFPIDSKSHQWFGATLHSAGEDAPIVACAPRYVYFGTKGDRRDPVGTCYVSAPDLNHFAEYSPCRTKFFGYHRQGSCQAGFSAALANKGDRLFLGAPGSYYWQGQVFSIDAHATFPYIPATILGAYGSGQVIQQALERRPPVVQTREGNSIDDDAYLGYSIAVGDFTGDGEQGVAVGKPRGARLLGQVNLFTWNLTNYQNISLEAQGGQIGTYFGYCIIAADVDGDGTDDLVVGAPLHAEANNEGKYEVGRVYVIYQGREAHTRFRRFNAIDGFGSKSRFGLSLAALGDVNDDGFADFAVGAPYDGPNERGAVYIYHGAKSLVDAKHSQAIFAEEAGGHYALRTFGFSVAGNGIDLDQNGYPDMVVGAYLSDAAFLFRARPIVKVDSSVDFLNRNKKVVLEEKNCTLRSGVRVACARVNVCMKFRGKMVPTEIDLDVQYVLDGRKAKDPRMFFMHTEDNTTMYERIRLIKDHQMQCREKMVYIKNDVRDKLTTLDIEVMYSMRGAEDQYANHPRDPRRTLPVILDADNTKRNTKDSLTIHKNCGSDNVCVPNLNLEVHSNVERFLLGSNEKLEFDVIVKNHGEDSFESTFDMRLPEGVNFNKIQQTGKTEVRILCSAAANNSIRCDIGNPLPAGKIARFKVLMDTAHHKEGMRPSYDFHMSVNSTNPEDEAATRDNRLEKSIPIWVNSKLELWGTSKPAEVYYNISQYAAEKIARESDIGPQVIHLYTVKNNGPSAINEAEVLFLWPYATLNGDDLLYLLEEPQTLGNMRCEAANANYLGYTLEYRKKSIWESLGIANNEFAGLTQPGGLVIFEGAASHGSTPKDVKHTLDKSDSALAIEERTKTTSGATEAAGSIIHVGEDVGTGSKVSNIHITSSNHTSASNSWSASTNSASAGNVVYTSTGHKPTSGIALTSGSTSLVSGSTMQTPEETTRESSGVYLEERKSGQVFNASDGGRITYEAGSYQRRNQTASNKHFNWSESRRSQQEEQRRQQQQQVEAQQRRYQEQLEARIRHEEELRRQREHETRIGAVPNFPYSEEEYTGSEENYQDLNTYSRGSYNRSHYALNKGAAHDINAAVQGQGFRTSTLDLGSLGGATSGGSYAHQNQYESSWTVTREEQLPDEVVGRDNVPTDRPNYNNRFHGRRRRQAEDDRVENFMQCKSTKCLTIRCTVGPLMKDQYALIALRSRVNVRTLRNISTSQSISFSSMMLARIEKLPYIGRPLNRTVHTHEIFTSVPAPEPDIKPDIVPLWVIVLSAVGGTIVLLLLIYLLHKLGFFKRNRPTDAPERQPLNRNAYYNGDQAL